MSARLRAVLVMSLLLSVSVGVPAVAAPTPQTILSAHWVPGWGFRDELNKSDIDYNNFWLDNAGKILTAAIFTNNLNVTNEALGFIQGNITSSYYSPEVVVDSSMYRPNSTVLTNRIVMLNTRIIDPKLRILSIGDYYPGPWAAAWIGADRIWYGGAAHKADSSTIVPLSNGYVKRSYFSFEGLSFYTFLNATVAPGEPFIRVSLQVQPLNSSFGPGDHLDLQAFASASGNTQQYALENATLFDRTGTLVGPAPLNSATASGHSAIVIAYSNRTSVLDQDSVALKFNSTGVASIEHWYHDGAFGGTSWVGLGYNVSQTEKGKMSLPVYADVYPIQHLDYRLLSDTAKYLASNPKDVAVSPPVSFGFIARGLALDSNEWRGNQTLRNLATGYWNFYYSRYKMTSPDTAYHRSIDLFALAGFELFGSNATVINFTREFVEGQPGASLEEYGWSAAALETLYSYTKSATDLQYLHAVENSFFPGGCHYLDLKGFNLNASYTFQFAEAAAGLLSSGSPYNSSAVLWAMNAVWASNVSGILRNQPLPLHGDLANTETIPAYILATKLFEGAMRSRTGGYWIEWTQGANITSITYTGGQPMITAVGNNGIVAVGTPNGTTIRIFSGTPPHPCSCVCWPCYLLVIVVVLFAASFLVWFFVPRRGFRVQEKVNRSSLLHPDSADTLGSAQESRRCAGPPSFTCDFLNAVLTPA